MFVKPMGIVLKFDMWDVIEVVILGISFKKIRDWHLLQMQQADFDGLYPPNLP